MTTTTTREERATRRANRLRREMEVSAILKANQAIVIAGKCPECGRKLRRNLALAGWWQCEQFGAVGFRADSNQPSCNFQCFTC